MMRKGLGLTVLLAMVCLVTQNGYAQGTLEDLRFTVERYQVTGDNPIGTAADRVLRDYVGEQYGLEGLSAARDALERAIIEAGFNFHRVSLPPQDLFEGTVRLHVSRFAIGRVSVEGNQFFDADNIRRSVPELQSGGTPNTRQLSRSLKIANDHAAKSTILRFREGTTPDTIDAVLAVQDRNPQVMFLSLDNTGPEDGEVWRTTLGYQHGNLFNADHAITATLTTAPEDPSSTKQIGVNYRIPLYRHGASVDLLFSDSDSAGETGGDTEGAVSLAPGVTTGGGQAIEITGEGTVLGAVYRRPILTDGSFNHDWSAGLQVKQFDNRSEFDGNELAGAELQSVPLDLGYSYTRQSPGSSFFGSATLVTEVGDDDDDYDADRAEAESGWTALRYNLSYDLLFAGDYLFHLGFSGQQTSNLLISGEQYGLGGVGTVRGFEERAVTGDSGYVLNLEVWFPPLTAYRLRFLAFADFGHTEFNDGDLPGNEGVEFDPSSVGVGMYWTWRKNLSVSLNYGSIVEGGGLDESANQDGDSKLHVSAVYRF